MTTGPRMWPQVLPTQVREDRYRKAEVRVYDLLREQLDAGWTVFYSRPWLGLTPTGGEKDGECDFVIVHPKHGYLAIEVKGGGITYDPATDSWWSTDRDKYRHSIKNPVDQARRAKYELLERAKRQRNWPAARFVRARHAVIFPDTESPPRNLGADKPRELFCCRSDLSKLGAWVLTRLSGGQEDELGSEGVQAFERLLAAPFTLRVPLGHMLTDDEQQIQCLTPQQFHILDSIAHLPRVAIGGGAGTGKTIVAMEDALRLAEAGSRTLLTCLSDELAADLRGHLCDKPVEVMSFPRLCTQMGLQAGIANASAAFSSDGGPELLLDAVTQEPSLRFDAIVVDEAQDFKPHWWVALDSALTDATSSRLHAFYDTNQRVYGELTGQLASFAMIPVRLSRNLRNTRAIHSATTHFYTGLPVIADGPDGVEVQWVECSTEEVAKTVANLAQDLCRQAINPGEVVILSEDFRLLQQLQEKIKGLLDRGLAVSSVRNFKGLERKVVILAATKELADEVELAYVALSRARVLLSVVGEPVILSWLQGRT
ncbi:NERD domain-containing protein [Paenalcaligenes niemegkensis]|uniref:nuclease-related domain-containing DEAD/DEAH box helicase n=1 Tax=Paenalcaligenes niemegkensis TaxID=2895469 RepID=UPI001EE7AE0B|nr:NERD domain-containing protein [Paenalcaligenes niemegkensis]MCQ9617975.1 NERD domain-containing protein [Paenalcaligenes niemegkensis]